MKHHISKKTFIKRRSTIVKKFGSRVLKGIKTSNRLVVRAYKFLVQSTKEHDVCPVYNRNRTCMNWKSTEDLGELVIWLKRRTSPRVVADLSTTNKMKMKEKKSLHINVSQCPNGKYRLTDHDDDSGKKELPQSPFAIRTIYGEKRGGKEVKTLLYYKRKTGIQGQFNRDLRPITRSASRR